MNKQDKEAFEKWLEARLDVSFEGVLFPKYIQYHSERYEAWQAALEYERGDYRQNELSKQLHHTWNELEAERAKAKKLVEAINIMIIQFQKDCTHTGCTCAINIGQFALAEYKAKEGGE